MSAMTLLNKKDRRIRKNAYTYSWCVTNHGRSRRSALYVCWFLDRRDLAFGLCAKCAHEFQEAWDDALSPEGDEGKAAA